METTERIRCRVTAHLPGGAVPGDVVLVDPTDPWMKSKIGTFLVPLDPYEPTRGEAPEGASPGPQEAPGADAASTPAETPPEEPSTAAAPAESFEGDTRAP